MPTKEEIIFYIYYDLESGYSSKVPKKNPTHYQQPATTRKHKINTKTYNNIIKKHRN